jgi:SAM-dependent methyltransferase
MMVTLGRFSQRFDPRWRFFHRIRHGGKILELGCGSGYNYSVLQSLSSTSEFYGVDLMPPADVPPQIVYTRLNLDEGNLPYPDSTFDASLFIHVIEHLKNPLALGEEVHRVLKPDGIIYVETPNWTSILVPSIGFKREQHGPFNFFDDASHVKPWTKHGVYDFLFQACKLRVERVATVRNWPRIPWDVAKIFYGLVSGRRQKVVSAFWNIYGWCIYGIGRKT